MRSPHPTPRRRRRHDPSLPALARLIDEATGEQPGHVLVHVEGPMHPELALGLCPIGSVHPFDLLAGRTAPPGWTAFGIRVRGRRRQLDDPAAPTAPSATTFVVDRRGREASLLRHDGGMEELAGPAAGTVPDLCRRVLRLPTAPPPESTALLWTLRWLDRVLDAWGQPHRRRDLTSAWGQVAALHPAVQAPTTDDLERLADPVALVEVGRAHAAASSWRSLRTSPVAFPLPDGPLEPDVATWMDDGFFARWSIGAFPSPIATVSQLRDLLGDPLGRHLSDTVLALLA